MTYSIPLKTHKRTDLTKKFEEELELCKIHNKTPQIMNIVAGKEKEHHFIAICQDDACGKISMESAEQVVYYWNLHNKV